MTMNWIDHFSQSSIKICNEIQTVFVVIVVNLMFCICLIFTFCFSENSDFRSDMRGCVTRRCISTLRFSTLLLTFSGTFIPPPYFLRVSREIGGGSGAKVSTNVKVVYSPEMAPTPD